MWETEWLHLNQDFQPQTGIRDNPMENPTEGNGLLRTLPHPTYVYSAKFHPCSTKQQMVCCCVLRLLLTGVDAQVIITGSFDKCIRVWDATAVEVLQKLEFHTAHINSIAVSPDGYRMFSASGNGELFLCRCDHCPPGLQ